MAKPGPQKINRYGIEFKLEAVEMSKQPGVLVQDVVESLCIHPFMLSRSGFASQTIVGPCLRQLRHTSLRSTLWKSCC